MKKSRAKKFNFWIYFNSRELTNRFAVCEFGWHKNDLGYTHGEVRNNYLIQFVAEGICYFEAEGKQYTLSKGDAFVVYPRTYHAYRSDVNNAPQRYWISLNGADCAQVMSFCDAPANHKVLHGINIATVEKCFEQLRLCRDLTNESLFKIYANAFRLLGLLVKPDKNKSGAQVGRTDELIGGIVDYINQNLHTGIKIDKLCDVFGYERSSLYRLFRKSMNVSIHQYIQDIQITKARMLLAETDMNIYEIAEAVGFSNYSSFSKMFVKTERIPPRQYRISVRMTKRTSSPKPKK